MISTKNRLQLIQKTAYLFFDWERTVYKEKWGDTIGNTGVLEVGFRFANSRERERTLSSHCRNCRVVARLTFFVFRNVPTSIYDRRKKNRGANI